MTSIPRLGCRQGRLQVLIQAVAASGNNACSSLCMVTQTWEQACHHAAPLRCRQRSSLCLQCRLLPQLCQLFSLQRLPRSLLFLYRGYLPQLLLHRSQPFSWVLRRLRCLGCPLLMLLRLLRLLLQSHRPRHASRCGSRCCCRCCTGRAAAGSSCRLAAALICSLSLPQLLLLKLCFVLAWCTREEEEEIRLIACSAAGRQFDAQLCRRTRQQR